MGMNHALHTVSGVEREPLDAFDAEDGITSPTQEIGDRVHWPGAWLLVTFALLCMGWVWDRSLRLLHITRTDTSPAARWQRWT